MANRPAKGIPFYRFWLTDQLGGIPIYSFQLGGIPFYRFWITAQLGGIPFYRFWITAQLGDIPFYSFWLTAELGRWHIPLYSSWPSWLACEESQGGEVYSPSASLASSPAASMTVTLRMTMGG